MRSGIRRSNMCLSAAWSDDWDRTCLEQNKALRKSHCYYLSDTIAGNVFGCFTGFRHCILCIGYSHLFSIHFRRNRACDSTGSGIIHCPGIHDNRTGYKTLIPMAALDDIVGSIAFFTKIAIVAGNLSAGDLPAYMIALVVLLPLVIGGVTGLAAGVVLGKSGARQLH